LHKPALSADKNFFGAKGDFVMKNFAAFTLIFSLGAASTPVLAEKTTNTQPTLAMASSAGPVKMTDDQLDNITAGDNICVVCANANVQAQILTNKSTQQTGNQNIQNNGQRGN
jgi:hypothetical protein